MEIKKYNGKVYVIRSPSTNKIYIGSTIETLSSRMSKHRYQFNNFIGSDNYNKWCQSYYILENLDAYIELLSEHQNISKYELRRFEGEAIRANKDICVNKIIAGRDEKESKKQYKKTEKAKDYNKKYMKEYHIKNKEKDLKYYKEYNKLRKQKNNI